MRQQQPYTLHLGDCLEVLRTLPDASVDSIVTDPPYELGFMGKSWDASGVAFNVDVWREALRVLKPGGHLLAFSGSRTYHRMACAIEDAEFEIRDQIMWLYGCLTADAEILTEHGWKNGLDVERGENVAQWDPATGSISLAPVQETFRAPYDGPMRVLRNADTDQVLTPNHRVYHQPRQRRMVAGVRSSWYDPEWQVAEAAELSTWNTLRLPVAGIHDGPGIGGDDYAALLGWVWTEGGFDLSGTGVRIYQSSVNADKVAEIAALMDRLGPHKRYDQQRTYTRRNGAEHLYTAVTWYFSGELAERVRADLPGKRPTYDLLWRMTTSEKRALLRAALLGDGSRQSSVAWQFYQKHEDDLVWFQTLLALVGQAGKIGMRTNRPGGAVYIRDTATTELQARHLRDTWEDYTGEVWCVRVPTGAFVARRNGRVFITGNSGFPKSLDVSKAIDKANGKDRPVVSQATDRRGDGTVYGVGHSGAITSNEPITAAAAAAAWRGRGTALKPAHEPIVVARKPLVGTVAANVLQFGTGALNIDGCRVDGGERPLIVGENDPRKFSGDFKQGSRCEGVTTLGRWPANVIHDGSEEVMAAFPDAPGQQRAVGPEHGDKPSVNCYGDMGARPYTPPRGDTGSAARFFKQVEVTDAEWLENLSPALIADSTLSLSKLADAIAQSDAAISALPEGRQLNVLKAPSTSVTPSESKLIATSVITAIQSIASASLLAQQPERLSLSHSHVSVVAHQTPTGIMMITASLSSSAGCAESITFSITPKSLAVGEKVCGQSSARFMYCAKASKRDRDEGLDHLPKKPGGMVSNTSGQHMTRRDEGYQVAPRANNHPTVKPTDLMRYLCRLVTPPGGTVLDPFMGSGSTGKAAMLEGFRFIGIEREAEYFEIARARIAAALASAKPAPACPAGPVIADLFESMPIGDAA